MTKDINNITTTYNNHEHDDECSSIPSKQTQTQTQALLDSQKENYQTNLSMERSLYLQGINQMDQIITSNLLSSFPSSSSFALSSHHRDGGNKQQSNINTTNRHHAVETHILNRVIETKILRAITLLHCMDIYTKLTLGIRTLHQYSVFTKEKELRERHEKKLNDSSKIISQNIRLYLAKIECRKEIRRKYEKLQLLQKKKEEELQLYNKMAIQTQKVFKGHLQRKQYTLLLIQKKENDASIKIANVWRNKLEWKQNVKVMQQKRFVEKEKRERNKACIQIQSFIRQRNAMNKFKKVYVHLFYKDQRDKWLQAQAQTKAMVSKIPGSESNSSTTIASFRKFSMIGAAHMIQKSIHDAHNKVLKSTPIVSEEKKSERSSVTSSKGRDHRFLWVNDILHQSSEDNNGKKKKRLRSPDDFDDYKYPVLEEVIQEGIPNNTLIDKEEVKALIIKIQNLWRYALARNVVIKLAFSVYEKYHVGDTNEVYWYNKRTGTSVWKKPTAFDGLLRKRRIELDLDDGKANDIIDPIYIPSANDTALSLERNCDFCGNNHAKWYDCTNCEAYCEKCHIKIHTKSKRSRNNVFFPITMCSHCDQTQVASKFCMACQDPYCDLCFWQIHPKSTFMMSKHPYRDLLKHCQRCHSYTARVKVYMEEQYYCKMCSVDANGNDNGYYEDVDLLVPARCQMKKQMLNDQQQVNQQGQYDNIESMQQNQDY